MRYTRLSSKGQIIIPKAVREMHHWSSGQALEVIDTPEGVLLRSTPPFAPTTLDEVAGSIVYSGPRITLEEMEQAIAEGVTDRDDRD